ncbi:MAG: D-alanyl-D-alanine carboxypeptidase family protein [Rhizobiaceae bacterium]
MTDSIPASSAVPAGPVPRRAVLLMLAGALLSGCATTSPEEAMTIPSTTPGRYSALVIDASNGKVLLDQNGAAPRYPASLTKMMTLFMLFEAMESGRVTTSTPIPVSAAAARMPPTKIGFRPGDAIDVESAINALCVKSANDVASAVGEFLGGSEPAFASLMTARARQLGMTATTFRNASGLPDPDQRTTARDMALLGLALRQRFPQHFVYFSARQFTFRGRMVRGHNDLLGRVDGVDGIKTGYIRASGYNIVTSVRTGGRSLIVVVMGADSARQRNAHVEDLVRRYLPLAAAGSTAFSAG